MISLKQNRTHNKLAIRLERPNQNESEQTRISHGRVLDIICYNPNSVRTSILNLLLCWDVVLTQISAHSNQVLLFTILHLIWQSASVNAFFSWLPISSLNRHNVKCWIIPLQKNSKYKWSWNRSIPSNRHPATPEEFRKLKITPFRRKTERKRCFQCNFSWLWTGMMRAYTRKFHINLYEISPKCRPKPQRIITCDTPYLV